MKRFVRVVEHNPDKHIYNLPTDIHIDHITRIRIWGTGGEASLILTSGYEVKTEMSLNELLLSIESQLKMEQSK